MTQMFQLTITPCQNAKMCAKKLFEAMTLNLLVEDVMEGNKTETCVVYSFDGSAMNGIRLVHV